MLAGGVDGDSHVNLCRKSAGAAYAHQEAGYCATNEARESEQPHYHASAGFGDTTRAGQNTGPNAAGASAEPRNGPLTREARRTGHLPPERVIM
jgi:hypothetical protein